MLIRYSIVGISVVFKALSLDIQNRKNSVAILFMTNSTFNETHRCILQNSEGNCWIVKIVIGGRVRDGTEGLFGMENSGQRGGQTNTLLSASVGI